MISSEHESTVGGALDITEEMFLEGRSPRYGSTNPERMEVPFWESMIRSEEDPYEVRDRLGIDREG
ncbi:MAG: hypothetical protein AAF488_08120 [Planctomycetota bacterium]